MINLSKYIEKAYASMHNKLLLYFSEPEVDSGLVALNEYLRLENLILRGCLLEQTKKIRFNSEEKWILANGASKILGRSKGRISLLTPDQIIKYAKQKAAVKHCALGIPQATTSESGKKTRISQKTKNAIMNEIITTHPKWDKMQICEEMRKYIPGISRLNIFDMIYDTGIWVKPSKKMGQQWYDFMNENGKVTWAGDFFTTEVWTDHGQRTFHTLFFVNLTTQEVFIAGTTEYCTSQWIVRTLNWYVETGEIPFDKGACCLIRDRDKRYSEDVDWLFVKLGLQPKKISPRAPIMNFPAESFVRKIKQECLSHCIFLSGEGLRRVIDIYTMYYNNWRPNSCRDGGYLNEDNTHWHCEGEIIKISFLPGILTYYFRRP